MLKSSTIPLFSKFHLKNNFIPSFSSSFLFYQQQNNKYHQQCTIIIYRNYSTASTSSPIMNASNTDINNNHITNNNTNNNNINEINPLKSQVSFQKQVNNNHNNLLNNNENTINHNNNNHTINQSNNTATTTTTLLSCIKQLFQEFHSLYKHKTQLLTNLFLTGKVLPANAIATVFFSFYKMKQNFKNRIFDQRITGSLNFIDLKTNTFKVRNVFCCNLEDVFINNQMMVHLVQEAALKTTKEDAIVKLTDVHDKWLILSLVQTYISQSVCASGYFRQDMGIPHHSEWYVFGITHEVDVSVKKMRVVMVQEKLLMRIMEGDFKEPNFEHIYGQKRWQTVKLMAKQYHLQYKQILEEGTAGDLMRVEIVLPGMQEIMVQNYDAC